MQKITLRELQNIMRECAGEDESTGPLEEAADQPFDDLGYDSLALLETQSRIQRDYGVELSDDDMRDIRTPQGLVDYVNGRLLSAA